MGAYTVVVEVDVQHSQRNAFAVVVLPDTAVQEARERVRSALKNSGVGVDPPFPSPPGGSRSI